MIKVYLARFLISAFLFIAVCFGATWVINPQSLTNFVGPSAALFSGLILIWGITPLVAVLLFSPLIAVGLHYCFDFDASLAVMIIAIQAIFLQGFWTKQLVYRFTHYQKWLQSRKHLFFFLLRIGPLASLVSACAVVIISMLENKIMEGNFFYTFVNTWSVSMLVAVFSIPLLLLIKNTENFKLTKRMFVGFTSILGGVAIFVVLKTSQHEQQSYRKALFEQSRTDVERAISAEVAAVANQVNSLSALFIAHNNVSLDEFTLFSQSIFQNKSSVRALEWAPIIPFAKKSLFEQESSSVLQRNIFIKERLSNGDIVVAQQRSQYAPLHYIYPQEGNEEALGLDVYTNPTDILSMQKVIETNDLIASAPLTLVQDKESKTGMLFSHAIFSMTPNIGSDLNSESEVAKLTSSTKEGQLLGFVVAVVQFEPFFQRLAEEQKQQVSIFIQDTTNSVPFTLFGQELTTENRFVDTLTMSMFSRTWQISIAEKSPWFSQTKSWEAWAVLIGATFGAVLFQMLILMMAAYSSELSLRVDLKTKALNSSKEDSERKSLAKSYFLQNLNSELRMPLMAIKAFVDQLKQKGINNMEVTGIHHASNNVEVLLDTMMDLSDIESGKIIAKEDSFDFYGFLQRTESLLKASNAYEGKSIVFLIDDNVPHYLNSDELYIQKLINALIDSAHHVLNSDTLRLSIKLHKHKSSEASLFFTLSSLNASIAVYNEEIAEQQSGEKLIPNNTAVAMAVKYSQLLKGDMNIGTLSSGEKVLSASIRVTISSLEQQEAQQGLTFDLL